jgi:hypothetical protein
VSTPNKIRDLLADHRSAIREAEEAGSRKDPPPPGPHVTAVELNAYAETIDRNQKQRDMALPIIGATRQKLVNSVREAAGDPPCAVVIDEGVIAVGETGNVIIVPPDRTKKL